MDKILAREGLPNYVDYLEALLGEPIRKDNRRLVDSLPIQQLNLMRERHHDAWRRFGEYTKKHTDLLALVGAPTPYRRKAPVLGEFRPVLHGRLHHSADLFGGDSGYPWESGSNLERLTGLKRLLLYSHGIVLADPLWYVNQYLGRDVDDEFSAKSRKALTNLLDFVYLVADLIRSDIILFYPQYEHTGVGFNKDLFRDDEFLMWYARPGNDSREWVVEVAYPWVIELMFYCVRNGASCFIDEPKMLLTFENVLRYGRALGGSHLVTRRDSAASEGNAALRLLARMPLPSLESLSLRDIVAVRRDSAGFNRFRDLLKEGLLRIDAGSSVDADLIEQAVSDSLAEGKTACDNAIHGSSLLSKVKENAGSFVVGAVAGALMGDPTGGLGTGAATACLTVLKEYVSGVKGRRSNAALARHYALWQPNS